MSELEKGIISDEALSEISGGLSIDKAKLEKSLIATGVVIASAAALTGAGVGVKKLLHDKNDLNTVSGHIPGGGSNAPAFVNLDNI